MSSSKRKLPKVGIFDPNLSQDPQFGNVHDLPDSWKRIHLHFSGTPDEEYYRFQIVFPECNIPKISSSHIDSVEKISVPVIKNFSVQFTAGKLVSSEFAARIGLFEADCLLVGPFPQINGSPGVDPIDYEKYPEALFIMNKPIAYYCFQNNVEEKVSNLAERGYICLQNYLNVFSKIDNKEVSFNVYIDYVVCETTYKEALIWQADFEKFISHKLKYGVDVGTNSVRILSRGTMTMEEDADPSKFDPYVKTSKLFKVQSRDVESAAIGTKEAVWAQAMRKYYK